MRIGISWPLGHGKRMWISGGPLTWLLMYLLFCAFGIVWLVAWLLVAIVQILFVLPYRAIQKIRANRE